jgi:hypothetical protein
MLEWTGAGSGARLMSNLPFEGTGFTKPGK